MESIDNRTTSFCSNAEDHQYISLLGHRTKTALNSLVSVAHFARPIALRDRKKGSFFLHGTKNAQPRRPLDYKHQSRDREESSNKKPNPLRYSVETQIFHYCLLSVLRRIKSWRWQIDEIKRLRPLLMLFMTKLLDLHVDSLHLLFLRRDRNKTEAYFVSTQRNVLAFNATKDSNEVPSKHVIQLLFPLALCRKTPDVYWTPTRQSGRLHSV